MPLAETKDQQENVTDLEHYKGNDVTLTHHWLVGMRGGEKVLEQFCLLFPEADVHCLVHDIKNLEGPITNHRIRGSFLQKLPFAVRAYKHLLPLHPGAVGAMKTDEQTKLVVCSDASMIKGIQVPSDAFLVCYCHSPPRYLWEMEDEYIGKKMSVSGMLKKAAFRVFGPYCRRFDYKAAQRVNLFIANSEFVANRIRQYYNRDAVVVNPPVDVDSFSPDKDREDFYLVVSALTPYKRIDLAIEAFRANGKRLIVIGDGPERQKLEADCPDNITILGKQPFSVLKQHYETCKALIFPGVEDFGITPLEAQAAGAPVVAFGQGGVLETVIEGKTGLFFHQQTSKEMNAVINKLDKLDRTTVRKACRENAKSFRPEFFRDQIRSTLSDCVELEFAK